MYRNGHLHFMREQSQRAVILSQAKDLRVSSEAIRLVASKAVEPSPQLCCI